MWRVLTRRDAATLLAAQDEDALVRIAAACGCTGEPRALDPAGVAALGLECPAGGIGAGKSCGAVRVVRGPGVLRALLLDIDSASTPVREMVGRVAIRLARRTPHLAWLCVARWRGADQQQLVVASWSSEGHPPRIAALVVECAAVVDSDAETLCALTGVSRLDDTLTHQRWLEVLGRGALTRRFYRALDAAVSTLASTLLVDGTGARPSPAERRGLALSSASRLLFLAFLEAKGWLDGDRGFLMRTFSDCINASGSFHARVLRPLFFGTLNTPFSRRARVARAFGRIPFLNGGLFAPTPLERRWRRARLSDEALGALFGDVLSRYRFTAREDRTSWSEAAVDPEMLGKAFESLMAPEERHASGAYYTPQALVERVTQEALAHALAGAAMPAATVAALLAGAAVGDTACGPLRERLLALRILDPACGSGAFLVYALELVATLVERLGDARPSAERRRQILTHCIFGVDINPTAVWLCELRLWLSVVIETGEADPGRVTPLPNLDRNVRIGDALAGGAFGSAAGDDASRTAWSRSGRLLARLRERYARASGAGKRSALRTLDRAERARAIAGIERERARVDAERRDALSQARGRDLFGASTGLVAGRGHRLALRARARALRSRGRALESGAALPFGFAVHFADVEVGGGFDITLGNPPWIRPHAVPLLERERLRSEFAVARQAAWGRGATLSRAGAGFGAQVDVAAMFAERAFSLTRTGGVVALLLPAKLWHSLAGGGVRQLVVENTAPLLLEDWSAASAAFDAAAYPSLLVARRLARSTTPSGGSVEQTLQNVAASCG